MLSLRLVKKSLLALVSLSTVSTMAGADEQMFAQVFTNWIVIVDDGVPAAECAAQVNEQTGFTVQKVHETIGVLLVTTPTTDPSALDAVPCVMVYEADGEMVAF